MERNGHTFPHSSECAPRLECFSIAEYSLPHNASQLEHITIATRHQLVIHSADSSVRSTIITFSMAPFNTHTHTEKCCMESFCDVPKKGERNRPNYGSLASGQPLTGQSLMRHTHSHNPAPLTAVPIEPSDRIAPTRGHS